MRLAVISDIHSDLPSLEKAINEIKASGVDRLLCLGDIVGYSYHYADHLEGRDPNACVEMVRQNCDYIICGNHDLHEVRKLPLNHKEAGIPGDWYDLDLGERSRISENRFWLYDDELEDPLNESSKAFLDQLPEQLVIQDKKFNMMATHFVWPDITGHRKSFPAKLIDFKDHIDLIKRNKCLVGLAGHAHPEGYAQISKKAFGLNYFRQGKIIRRPQLIIVPAITRSDKSRNGYLVLDSEKYTFESIPID